MDRDGQGESGEEEAMEAIRDTSLTSASVGAGARGYVEAENKEKLKNRLKRIEGQVRGVQRMVDEEAYCVDVLTQIAGVVSALEKAGVILLKDHVEHCVREAVEDGEKAEEKIEELTAAVERFLRV
jgi:CsoR family transcriptional regulator, copper-sensing transcriptional repressor